MNKNTKYEHKELNLSASAFNHHFLLQKQGGAA
jgi:hypothetical protein